MEKYSEEVWLVAFVGTTNEFEISLKLPEQVKSEAKKSKKKKIMFGFIQAKNV